MQTITFNFCELQSFNNLTTISLLYLATFEVYLKIWLYSVTSATDPQISVLQMVLESVSSLVCVPKCGTHTLHLYQFWAKNVTVKSDPIAANSYI